MKFVKHLMAAALITTAIAGSAFAVDEAKDKASTLTRYGFAMGSTAADPATLTIDDAAVDAFQTGIDVNKGTNNNTKLVKQFLGDVWQAVLADPSVGGDVGVVKTLLAKKKGALTFSFPGFKVDAPTLDAIKDGMLKSLPARLKLSDALTLKAIEHGLELHSPMAGAHKVGDGTTGYDDAFDYSAWKTPRGTGTAAAVTREDGKLSDLFGAGKPFDGMGGTDVATQRKTARAIDAYAATIKPDLTDKKVVRTLIVDQANVLQAVVEDALAKDQGTFIALLAQQPALKAVFDMQKLIADTYDGSVSGFDGASSDVNVLRKGIQGLVDAVATLQIKLDAASKAKTGNHHSSSAPTGFTFE